MVKYTGEDMYDSDNSLKFIKGKSYQIIKRHGDFIEVHAENGMCLIQLGHHFIEE